MKKEMLRQVVRDMERAVCKAGEQALLIRQKGLNARIKNDGGQLINYNIVTDGDLASERIIKDMLYKKYPEIAFRGEEENFVAKQSEWEFVVDPIDGTLPYSIGCDYFGVSVGLVNRSRPMAGVIYFPGRREMLSVVSGNGVYLNNEQMPKFNSSRSLNEAIIGFDFMAAVDRKPDIEKYLTPLFINSRYVMTYGCVTWAAMNIVKGRLDAYVHPGATPYDLAAVWVIIEELGGCIEGLHNSLDITYDFISVVFAKDRKIVEKIKALFN